MQPCKDTKSSSAGEYHVEEDSKRRDVWRALYYKSVVHTVDRAIGVGNFGRDAGRPLP